jgi:hypothetical protein
MTGNAGFKFNNRVVPENHIVFDGDTGQSVTLEELIRRRTENQTSVKSTPVSDFLPKSNWRIIESKLNKLFDEDYDEEFLPPTDEIFRSVKEILLKLNDFLSYEMTIPSFVIPDGEGGIRIEWKIDDKHLRLALSEKKLYLYFEHNGISNGIQNFSAEQLVEKLRWLNKK